MEQFAPPPPGPRYGAQYCCTEPVPPPGSVIQRLTVSVPPYSPAESKSQRAGLTKLRFHDLRHTHATLMLMQGVHPKVISDRLGHSTVKLTMGTYSHVLPGIQREAAQKMDDLFQRSSRQPLRTAAAS